MTALDAAMALGKTEDWVVSELDARQLPYQRAGQRAYFEHETARNFFQYSFDPRVIAFQIAKGGTGKTSLVYEFAVRASLYGARVLCIDMDQQGNLTHALDQDAETLPVMIDILVDNHPLQDAIVPVIPGIDLIASRFENAMLDEVLRVKKIPLDVVYRDSWQALKSQYDLIVVDCPPSLGQSVVAAALAADFLIAPVTPEKFALSGLDTAYRSIEELQERFQIPISFGVVLNKFEARTNLSLNALKYLRNHPKYGSRMLKNYVRISQEFPKAISNCCSVFESPKPTSPKEDIDYLTRELLGIEVPHATSVSIADLFSDPLEARTSYVPEDSVVGPFG